MEISEYREKASRTDYSGCDGFHTSDASPGLDYALIGHMAEAVKVLDWVKNSKKDL